MQPPLLKTQSKQHTSRPNPPKPVRPEPVDRFAIVVSRSLFPPLEKEHVVELDAPNAVVPESGTELMLRLADFCTIGEFDHTPSTEVGGGFQKKRVKLVAGRVEVAAFDGESDCECGKCEDGGGGRP